MKLDVVIPFYNEEACAKDFVEQLLSGLSSIPRISPRMFLVNDGSSDRTDEILEALAAAHACVEVIHLWGNHGHQKALIAGLDRCDGDAVLMLDGDGQHPPGTALKLVDIMIQQPAVYMVQAVRRGAQSGKLKDLTSVCFYKVLALIMPDVKLMHGASDFRVIRGPVVDLLKAYPDRYRNLRVLFASLNLPTTYVAYDVADRMAGCSRYRVRQMLLLATNGWFAFSTSPLRLSLLLMCFCGSVGILYLLYVVMMFVAGKTVPGWTSIIFFMTFMFSAVFGVLAILSEYVAQIYEDVKGRPIYRLRPPTSCREIGDAPAPAGRIQDRDGRVHPSADDGRPSGDAADSVSDGVLRRKMETSG